MSDQARFDGKAELSWYLSECVRRNAPVVTGHVAHAQKLEAELRAANERAITAEHTLRVATERLEQSQSAAYIGKLEIQARTSTERAEAAEHQLEIWKVCNTCGGGPHPSGLVCVCGGTGSSVDELVGLRQAVLKAEQRVEQLEKCGNVLFNRASHYVRCKYLQGGGDCDCGVTQVRKEWKTLTQPSAPVAEPSAPESTMEHIARDIREGRLPQKPPVKIKREQLPVWKESNRAKDLMRHGWDGWWL